MAFSPRSRVWLVAKDTKLNDSILSGYKSYYDKYSKVITAYSDKVTVRGLDG